MNDSGDSDPTFLLALVANETYSLLKQLNRSKPVKVLSMDRYKAMETWLGIGLSISLTKQRLKHETEQDILSHIEKTRLKLSGVLLPHERQALEWDLDCSVDKLFSI